VTNSNHVVMQKAGKVSELKEEYMFSWGDSRKKFQEKISSPPSTVARCGTSSKAHASLDDICPVLILSRLFYTRRALILHVLSSLNIVRSCQSNSAPAFFSSVCWHCVWILSVGFLNSCTCAYSSSRTSNSIDAPVDTTIMPRKGVSR
jgi:hypothetical protein